MLEKTRSIGLRQRRGIKDVGWKHRDAGVIHGERRAWERRAAKGKHWQEEFTCGRSNAMDRDSLPDLGTLLI